jgi:predicted NAD-dependent protein-ADP-ribosyltransferase YbiA (DUF1768 family)
MADLSPETLMNISGISNQEQLIDYINLGNRAKYLSAEHYQMAEKARLFGDRQNCPEFKNCS